MERYSEITQKQEREIVLLRGSGCVYKKCAFCDYHTDCSNNENENFSLNAGVLSRVTGKYGELEVINSGSVFELDDHTISLIRELAVKKGIGVIHFESHFLYANKIPMLREYFAGIVLKLKLGLETFDFELRENVLKKGIKERDPAVISRGFDEANLLFGIKGQTVGSMQNDITLGLKYFERICINIMCKNTSAVKPDKEVISCFKRELYPKIADDPRADILLNNTDFGVGE